MIVDILWESCDLLLQCDRQHDMALPKCHKEHAYTGLSCSAMMGPVCSSTCWPMA